MKKIIIIAFLLLAFIFACGYASADFNEMYTKTTVVVDVNYSANLVFVKDFNGELWAFFGCEDWQAGDLCSLLMDSNGTEQINDDIILDAKYSGWIF